MAALRCIAQLSHRGGAVNEDAVGVLDHAAWVIDGATGVFGRAITPGPSDAAWLAGTLDAALQQAFAAPTTPGAALTGAADEVERAFAAAMRENAPPPEQPSACVALAALDAGGGLHLANIGDCRILLELADGSVRSFGSSAIDQLESACIAELVRLRALHGPAFDVRGAVRPLIRRNFEILMNKPGGYWVAHPTLAWLAAVQHERMPAAAVRHVLIVSDGLYRLVDVCAAYDEAQLLRAAIGPAGLYGLLAELRRLEAADGACERYPRLKPSDDASGVLLRVS